ncbi:hypothetical protein EIN_066050 [Entamoeba invadens IP1]|uniref:Uncharacterized protein n=1 Tax=Entamoeba invadens IP1 TaxID=370355 RepID=A0A0A1TXP9_ENTIV|nr:hypothetical protein EIN_066050 [Entamoeba invadens IP1]ELP84320.1 hypothetical protein EIN_066050 [Entamoeba invadens IP1]|eukprot:XP_004183666.1 hypothetical protein EIN_066050 [Entamoeba invadens IP1]
MKHLSTPTPLQGSPRSSKKITASQTNPEKSDHPENNNKTETFLPSLSSSESQSASYSSTEKSKTSHSSSSKYSKTSKGSKSSKASKTSEDSSAGTSASDSSQGLQEIIDLMQSKIAEYKQLLDSTRNQYTEQITVLTKERNQLNSQLTDNNSKLLKAADTIKTMFNDLKDLTATNKKLSDQKIKDSEDLAALYSRLGQLENSGNKESLNELELSVVLKLERNEVIKAEVVKKNLDEQKRDLKLSIQVLEKNLMQSKSENLNLRTENDTLNRKLSNKNDLESLCEKLKKEKMDVEAKLAEQISKLKTPKKGILSFKGESNDVNTNNVQMKDEALALINKFTTVVPHGIFDTATYEEFNLIQKHNMYHPYMFTHIQAQCYAKLKETIDSFVKVSTLETVKRITSYEDIYKEVSTRAYFATFMKKVAPHLHVYHNVMVDVIQFSMKFDKKSKTTLAGHTQKKSLAFIPATVSTSEQATNVMNNQILRRRRPTMIGDMPKYSNFSLLTQKLSKVTEPKECPSALSAQSPLSTGMKEETKEEMKDDYSEENNDKIRTKFVCWTGKELWAFKDVVNGETVVYSYVPRQIDKYINKFSVIGEVVDVIGVNEFVCVAKRDNSIDVLYRDTRELKTNFQLEEGGSIIEMFKAKSKVLVLTAKKVLYTLDIKNEKKKAEDVLSPCEIRSGTIVEGKKRMMCITGEVSKVVRGLNSIWAVYTNQIFVLDIDNATIKKTIPINPTKIKLIGKQMWVLQHDGTVNVYDCESLELVANHVLTKSVLFDVTEVFLSNENIKQRSSNKKEWICVVSSESDGLIIVQTSNMCHDWIPVDPKDTTTHTCYTCDKKFSKGGLTCKNCKRVYFCDKCSNNVDLVKDVMETEICLHLNKRSGKPRLSRSIKASDEKKEIEKMEKK